MTGIILRAFPVIESMDIGKNLVKGNVDMCRPWDDAPNSNKIQLSNW